MKNKKYYVELLEQNLLPFSEFKNCFYPDKKWREPKSFWNRYNHVSYGNCNIKCYNESGGDAYIVLSTAKLFKKYSANLQFDHDSQDILCYYSEMINEIAMDICRSEAEEVSTTAITKLFPEYMYNTMLDFLNSNLLNQKGISFKHESCDYKSIEIVAKIRSGDMTSYIMIKNNNVEYYYKFIKTVTPTFLFKKDEWKILGDDHTIALGFYENFINALTYKINHLGWKEN